MPWKGERDEEEKKNMEHEEPEISPEFKSLLPCLPLENFFHCRCSMCSTEHVDLVMIYHESRCDFAEGRVERSSTRYSRDAYCTTQRQLGGGNEIKQNPS